MRSCVSLEQYKQKVTKQTLTEKMADLNDILNNSWDGIGIIDEFGNFIYTNQAFSPILNYSKSEILKLNFFNIVDSSTRDVIKFGIIKAQKLGCIKNLKLICIRKDKKKVYLEASLALMGNKKYFVLNARDCTEEITKKTLINKYILSCRLDLESKIIEISDALGRLLKYEKHELLKMSFSKFHYKFEEDTTLESIYADLHQDDWIGILYLNDKEQNTLCFDTRINAVFNKYGDIVGYECIFFDITSKNAIAPQSNGNFSDGFKIFTDMMNKVTSKWLDPLNVIDTKVHKIQNEQDLGVIKDIATDILKTKEALTKDIEVFKQNFVINESIQKVDLYNLLFGIVTMLETKNTKNNITIKSDLQKIAPTETIPGKLTDIIFGLITNSLEAFKRKKIDDALLDISMHEVQNEILIQIIDNAGGIHPDIISRIFDPYFSTKNEPGKGLGLYMAKNIVENILNGKLSIESKEDITVAIVSLPK